MWVFDQKQNRDHVSTTLFCGLGPRRLFPLPKTECTDERKAFGYDWGDKRQFETGTVGDTKKYFENIISEACYFEGDKIVIDK